MLSISEALSLAFQQYQAGSREQAKQLCAKILEKSPNHADTLHLLGILKYQAGNVAEALDLYQRVLKLMPDNPDAHSNLGMVLRQQGKVADAIAHYRQAIRLRPKSAAFHNNLSVALNQVGNISEALEHWQEAIRLNPDYTEALVAAGNVLIKQGNFSTGINYWRQAVKLKPNSMKLHNDLGMALKEQGLLTEARYHLEEAVALKPDSAEVITNLGSVYKEENLLAEAKQQYQKALSLKANFAEAHFNLGLVYLLQGDLKQGFTEYSWRWQIPGQNINPIPKPLWDGSSLAGKTILLHTEQGFGDAIQFIRYASIIASQGGKVVVGCPTALVRLFQTVPGIEKVATQTTELPSFDCHAPLMKLPQILGTTLETIPNQVPYLFVTGKEQESKQTSSNLPYKIGIVWAAGVRGADSQKRSCALPNLVQGLLNVPGVELYSLQKEPNEADLQFLQSSGIIDLRAQLNDFADTAEAISQLDLVISVDTAVAHLAGAMGKPVWILLPFAPDWRWMLARDDTPWYPSMRLFRQPAPGEWEAVFQQVTEALSVNSHQLPIPNPQSPIPNPQSPIPNPQSPIPNPQSPSETEIVLEIKGGDAVTTNTPRVAKPISKENIAKSLQQALKHYQAGRFAAAEQICRKIVQSEPQQADALHLLGILAYEQGNKPEAIAKYRQAIEIKPDNPDVYNNLAIALKNQGDLDAAIVYYQQAISLRPNSADLYKNLGLAYKEKGLSEQAAAAYQQAITIQPEQADLYNKLGMVYRELGLAEEAIVQYQQALKLKPDWEVLYNNLGNAHREKGDLASAKVAYHQAIAIRSNYAQAQFGLAGALLMEGDFQRGFQGYEWRWKLKDNSPRKFPQPIWDGSSLAGRTILLHAEQGLGDTIQFIRYVSRLKAQGARVVVETQNALVELFQVLDDIDEVVGRGKPLPDFDVHSPLLSLSRVFGDTIDTIPTQVPYLFPPADNQLHLPNCFSEKNTVNDVNLREQILVDDINLSGQDSVNDLNLNEEISVDNIYFGEQNSVDNINLREENLVKNIDLRGQNSVNDIDLTEETSVDNINFSGQDPRTTTPIKYFKVGLVWAGNPENPTDYKRSSSLEYFRKLLDVNRVAFYSLQKEPGSAQLKEITEERISDLSDELNNFADTATAISQLDLVITVDTAVAHLAGALGKPVWVLLCYAADWRWMLAREDSPWYPTMRLFRQSQPNDWQGVIDRVKQELQLLAANQVDSADKLVKQAIKAYRQERFVEAKQICSFILQSAPTKANKLHILAVLAYQQRDFYIATQLLEKVIALQPENAEIYTHLAVFYQEQGKLAEAITKFQQALTLQPEVADTHNKLGVALKQLGKIPEAVTAYRRALELNPHDATIHNNLANSLRILGKWSEAEQHCETAIALDPNCIDARFCLANLKLIQGDLLAGFAGYEYRKRIPRYNFRTFSQPVLTKETLETTSLQGQTILVYAEQGFGDTIQFVRYVLLLVAKGAKVVLECHPPLQKLFADSFSTIEVISQGESLSDFDVQASMMSLPHIFGTTLTTIPNEVPYLQAKLGKNKLISANNQFKVGIAWAGNPENWSDRWRSSSLKHFLGLLSIPGIEIYSLQKGKAAAELTQYDVKIQDLSGEINNFADTAAIISQLDLVITVDTAVAHLAGALGKPVWTILSHAPDWRWLLDRQDSPWYPTMRLFRQPEAGDWESVFTQIQQELQQLSVNSEQLPVNSEQLPINSEQLPVNSYQSSVTDSQSPLTSHQLPRSAKFYNKRGANLKEQGKLAAAKENFEQAIAIEPNFAVAYHNLGNTLKEENQLEAALKQYEKAISLKPNYADAHLDYALTKLMLGDFATGFAEYEWRWLIVENQKRDFTQPQWDGSSLAGKTILLYGEQGFGDTIQFSRYIPFVKERGARRIVVECYDPLVRLIATVGGVSHVVAKGAELPDFDVQISLMSLPHIFGTTLETVPNKVPYLSPLPEKAREGENKTNPNLKVGIVWAGNPHNRIDSKRSCQLQDFESLLEIADVEFYSLQKWQTEADLEKLSQLPIEDLSNSLEDFADTANAIAPLDLVITVDTAVAHLAGALGKPVWVLLPFAPDWRWMLNRQDSPWYPTMQLFRQPKAGDWESVFTQVKQELQQLSVTSKQSPVTSHQSPVTKPQPPSKPKALGIGWQLNPMLGWGVYGLNLTLQLIKNPNWEPFLLMPPAANALANPLHSLLLRPLLNQPQQLQKLIKSNPGKKIACDFPILSALGNDFAAPPSALVGKKQIGVIFFENTRIEAEAIARAKSYDLIVVGSNWNEQVLRSKGITNVTTVQQGIEPTIFHPAPKANLLRDRFVIFSGGKLEYRKGQDLVIAAFKKFHNHHPEALLMVAWHNFWPQFIRGIERAGHVRGIPQVDNNKRLQIIDWLAHNNIPKDAVIDIGPTANNLMGQIVREADVALFPNRCEGGTNLVAMECMACGIPTILSANTGHLDLIQTNNCYPLHQQSKVEPIPQFPGTEGWGESDIDEIVAILETVYQNREQAQQKGTQAAQFMQNWTWEKQIQRLLTVFDNTL